MLTIYNNIANKETVRDWVNEPLSNMTNEDTDLPIGIQITAWITGILPIEPTRLYKTTHSSRAYGADMYGGHKGDYLDGIWVALGWAGTQYGVANCLFKRIL